MIKLKNTIVAGLSALLLFGFSSCGDKVDGRQVINGVLSIGTSSNNEIKAVSKEGTSFFLKITTPDNWALTIEPESAKEWVKASTWAGEGSVKNKPIRIDILKNTAESRTAKLFLTSNGAYKQLTLSQSGLIVDKPDNGGGYKPDNGGGDKPTPGGGGAENPQTGDDDSSQKSGSELNGEHLLGDNLGLLELPELEGGQQNYFVTHKTSDGTVNYSYEYNVDKRHSRWVAFQFNEVTIQKHTKRTNAWDWYSEIPRSYSTETWYSKRHYKGYDLNRGHLASSGDRSFSREANKQTFDYANMSPQIGKLFNQGYYRILEEKVQGWARNRGFSDVLYIAKGGTIRDDQIWDWKIRGKMVIPSFYFMAIVVKKNDKYHGIAFWMKHTEYTQGSFWPSHREITCSIDELEKKTGINFFCNFPDDLENKFEAETASSYNWPGL